MPLVSKYEVIIATTRRFELSVTGDFYPEFVFLKHGVAKQITNIKVNLFLENVNGFGNLFCLPQRYYFDFYFNSKVCK